MPCGVIDFGDVTRTLRACELAVAASVALGHDPDDPICAAAEIVRGFDAACPLDDAELEALPHLIAARAAIVAVGTEQQARARAAQRLRPERAGGRLGDLRGGGASMPLALAEAAFRLACGRSVASLAPRVPRGDAWPLPDVAPGAASTSRRERRARRRRVAIAAARRAAARRGRRHGEARLHATRELSNAEPATIHLGLDVFAPARQRRCARRSQVASSVAASGELVLAADGARAAPGRARARGRGGRRASRRAPLLGHLGEGGELPPHLHVQVAPPGAARAARAS